jgi:hypothetical protein
VELPGKKDLRTQRFSAGTQADSRDIIGYTTQEKGSFKNIGIQGPRTQIPKKEVLGYLGINTYIEVSKSTYTVYP